MPMSIISILAKLIRSFGRFEKRMITAAPADNPEVRNNGPKIDVFQSGRALNAENRIPNSVKAEAVEEPKIYEVVDDDANDQPPELEQVDIEAEREKIQKQKD